MIWYAPFRTHRCDRRSRTCPAIVFTLLLAASTHALAQTETPSAASISTPITSPKAAEPAAVINGYAENLLPKAKRSQAIINRPYQPVTRQDDQALVPEIEMFVGESRVFPTPNVGRIAVGNGAILSAAALDKREVILFANAVGTSSLFIWNEDGRYQRLKINIVPGDTSRFAREIAAFLTGIPNTKASIIGDKVIVEGDDLADLDIAKIDELSKRYPQIVNFTNRLGWEQMVLMDVKVVEFPTTELRDIGMKWTSTGGAALGAIWAPVTRGSHGALQIGIQSGSGNAVPITNADGSSTGIPVPSGLNILSGINLGINAQLNLLVQNGKASILAQPQLSARNGAKASFLAGGEYPYTVSTINGPTVLFKPYGVRLDIVPRVDRNGVIRATVDSEVSEIDSSFSTTAGPALSTRKTSTEFNVRNGETLVLAGLLSRKTSTNIDKVPLLGDIPILGPLFRSTRFQNDETELVVFVTPHVIDSRSPGLIQRVTSATARLEAEAGKPPYLIDPVQALPDAVNAPLGTQITPQAANSPEHASAAAGPGAQNPSGIPGYPESSAPTIARDGEDRTLQVKVDRVAVYTEPDMQSPVLLQLGRGSVIHMASDSLHRSGRLVWREVVVGSIRGWVEDKAVQMSGLDKPVAPARRGATVRDEREGQFIAQVPATGASAAPVPGSITANRPSPLTNSANSPKSARGPKAYRVLLDGLVMRVTPDVNAPAVDRLASGTLVEALPQTAQGYWFAVQVNGKRGWVASQWLIPERVTTHGVPDAAN